MTKLKKIGDRRLRRKMRASTIALDSVGVSHLKTRTRTGLHRTQWRWLTRALGVGLGGFLVWQLALFGYEMLHRAPEAIVAKNKRPVPQISAPPVTVQSDQKLAAIGTDSSISKVPLQLVLVRTLPGQNATKGTAMIGTDARNAQTYIAGAMLENGARLVEIYRDRVVLERHRERASLYLFGSPTTHESTAKISPLLAVGGVQTLASNETRYSVDAVADYLRAVPSYRDDGTVGGFRVLPGERSGPFASWGLQAGDIVTSIDGSPLLDADQATQLLRPLAEGAALTARVKRGTQSLTVTLDGADIVKINEQRNAPPIAMQPPPQ